MSVVFLVFVHLSILLVFHVRLPICLSKVFRQTILTSSPWCSSFSSIYLYCQSFPPHLLSAYLRYFVRQYSRRVRGVPRFRPSSLLPVFPATLPLCLSKVFRQTILPVVSVVFLVFVHLSILLVFHVRLPICLSKVFRQTILPSCPWCSSFSSIYRSCQSFPPHFLSAYLRYFVRQYSRRVRGVPRYIPSIYLASLSLHTCSLPI